MHGGPYDGRPEQKSVQPMYFSKNWALFIQDEHKIKDYLFTGGLRYETDSEYGDILIPRFALTGSPGPLNFKLLYGQAFKAPTVFELHDEWRGNDKLEPQKIKTSEVELSYQPFDKMYLQFN